MVPHKTGSPFASSHNADLKADKGTLCNGLDPVLVPQAGNSAKAWEMLRLSTNLRALYAHSLCLLPEEPMAPADLHLARLPRHILLFTIAQPPLDR